MAMGMRERSETSCRDLVKIQSRLHVRRPNHALARSHLESKEDSASLSFTDVSGARDIGAVTEEPEEPERNE